MKFSSPRLTSLFLLTAVALFVPDRVCLAQDEDNRAVDDLFFFKPETNSERVRAAVLADQLDRPTIALLYLNELITLQPDASTLLELRAEYGIGTFLRLSSREELLPTSRDLLTMINQASRQAAPSEDGLRNEIGRLGQSPQDTREAALRILTAESAAALPLLEADPSTPSGKLADQLLSQHSRRFRHGLLAALPDADEAGRVRILNLLETSADGGLIPDLLLYRFSASEAVAKAATDASSSLALFDDPRPEVSTAAEAAAELQTAAIDLLTRAGQTFPSQADRETEGILHRRTDMFAEPAIYGATYVDRAAQLSADAAQISPDSISALATAKLAVAAQQAWPLRWPQDMAPVTFDKQAVADISDVDQLAIQYAFDTNNAAAQFALLAQAQTSIPILKKNPMLLRKCLYAGDVRVRLLTAALLNAAGINSRFNERVVTAAVKGGQTAETVVIDSQQGMSVSNAALMRDLKYLSASSSTGRGGFDGAVTQLNCEMILLHSRTMKWSVAETIANLRADYRTKETPIVIYGPLEDQERITRIRSRHNGIWYLQEPLSEFTWADSTRLAGVPQPRLTDDERLNMKRFARTLR